MLDPFAVSLVEVVGNLLSVASSPTALCAHHRYPVCVVFGFGDDTFDRLLRLFALDEGLYAPTSPIAELRAVLVCEACPMFKQSPDEVLTG